MRGIDAHQHFRVYNESDYVWMGPEHEAITRGTCAEFYGLGSREAA